MRHILCLLWVAAVLQAQTAAPKIPEHPFVALNGPYAVGVHEVLWIDQKRDEPFTQDPNDHRHVLARIWYPAEKSSGTEKGQQVIDEGAYGCHQI